MPTQEVDGISFSLISLSSPPALYTHRHFVTDGKRTALLPEGIEQYAFPRCLSKEGAHEFDESHCFLKKDRVSPVVSLVSSQFAIAMTSSHWTF